MSTSVSRPLMERHLGRPLEKTEFVHHINGNKRDNRLENLLVVSPKEHRRLHPRFRRQERNMVTDKQEFVTITRAAELLGVSRQTIHSWIRLNKLIPVRIMGLPYLPLDAVTQIKKAKGG